MEQAVNWPLALPFYSTDFDQCRQGIIRVANKGWHPDVAKYLQNQSQKSTPKLRLEKINENQQHEGNRVTNS